MISACSGWIALGGLVHKPHWQESTLEVELGSGISIVKVYWLWCIGMHCAYMVDGEHKEKHTFWSTASLQSRWRFYRVDIWHTRWRSDEVGVEPCLARGISQRSSTSSSSNHQSNFPIEHLSGEPIPLMRYGQAWDVVPFHFGRVLHHGKLCCGNVGVRYLFQKGFVWHGTANLVKEHLIWNWFLNKSHWHACQITYIAQRWYLYGSNTTCLAIV